MGKIKTINYDWSCDSCTTASTWHGPDLPAAWRDVSISLGWYEEAEEQYALCGPCMLNVNKAMGMVKE